MRLHPDTAFAVLDGVEPECDEIAQTMLQHLVSHWPDRYSGVVVDPSLHPLDAIARLVPKDLVILVERDGHMVCGGGSVCFPNRWDLRSKLGASLAAVHAPVGRLNEQLEAVIDGFIGRLRPERSFWRLGWGILDTSDGYTPVDGTAAPRPSSPTLKDLHVRVERETLRRFPHTNAVLFTIRTYLTPLRSVLDDPEDAEAIRRVVDVMPTDVRSYKEITDVMRASLG
jgi:hypothetical protein